jgi:hypothetical protein
MNRLVILTTMIAALIPAIMTPASAAAEQAGVAVTTPEMCALAGRAGDGRATPGDLKLTERLIMALVDKLPADFPNARLRSSSG